MYSAESKGAALPWQVICQGNSLTDGPPGGTPYPIQLRALLGNAVGNVWKCGVGGYTTSQLISLSPLPMLNRTGKYVLVLWEGANAIYYGDGSGRTAAGLFADISRWCGIYRAAPMSSCKIIVPNITPATTIAGYESLRLAYNALLASQWASIADATVDVASLFPDTSDATKFMDGVHFTTLGYGLVASAVETAVRASM
jgi:hypothetical protein